MTYPLSRIGALLLCGVAAPFVVGQAAAHTAASTPPAAQSSPFFGTWELDLTRLPDSYGPPPKRVTYSFEDIGGGRWLTNIDITAPDGKVRHIGIRYSRDGRMVGGEGDVTADERAAFNAPAPNVLVMSLSRAKVLGSVRTYAVSADGREMTESAADVNPAGEPFVRNFHYKRIG